MYIDKVCIHVIKIKLDDIVIKFFITEHHWNFMSFACIVNPCNSKFYHIWKSSFHASLKKFITNTLHHMHYTFCSPTGKIVILERGLISIYSLKNSDNKQSSKIFHIIFHIKSNIPFLKINYMLFTFQHCYF